MTNKSNSLPYIVMAIIGIIISILGHIGGNIISTLSGIAVIALAGYFFNKSKKSQNNSL